MEDGRPLTVTSTQTRSDLHVGLTSYRAISVGDRLDQPSFHWTLRAEFIELPQDERCPLAVACLSGYHPSRQPVVPG